MTTEQLYNQPDFAAYREFCEIEGIKMSDYKSLRAFMDYHSRMDVGYNKMVYDFEPHYYSDSGYMTFEDGEKFLTREDDPHYEDEYICLHDSPPTYWYLVDELFKYYMKCVKENRNGTKIK